MHPRAAGGAPRPRAMTAAIGDTAQRHDRIPAAIAPIAPQQRLRPCSPSAVPAMPPASSGGAVRARAHVLEEWVEHSGTKRQAGERLRPDWARSCDASGSEACLVACVAALGRTSVTRSKPRDARPPSTHRASSGRNSSARRSTSSCARSADDEQEAHVRGIQRVAQFAVALLQSAAADSCWRRRRRTMAGSTTTQPRQLPSIATIPSAAAGAMAGSVRPRGAPPRERESSRREPTAAAPNTSSPRRPGCRPRSAARVAPGRGSRRTAAPASRRPSSGSPCATWAPAACARQRPTRPARIWVNRKLG